MQYSLLMRFKNFAIQHRRLVVLFFCFSILGILFYVFDVSYSRREDNEEFSEIQKLVATYRKKDKGIYNNLAIEEIDEVAKGIDVSSWQKKINFAKVKNSGIDFIIIRCGFRLQQSGAIKEDKMFKTNISEANKYGIPVGVYFYSAAINREEALEEASFVLNLIKDYEVVYPVIYDFEMFNIDRAKGIDDNVINNNAKTFLSYIEEHGYKAMLYTNLHDLKNHWNMEKLHKYKIWYAQYAEMVNYEGDYEIWQYANNGRIDGIVGNVDLNESYITYKKIGD